MCIHVLISENEKCEVEHIVPNVIVPQNKSSARLEEPVYSNIPYHNAAVTPYTLPYYDRIPYNDTYKILSYVPNSVSSLCQLVHPMPM